jgi:hypothetical protein
LKDKALLSSPLGFARPSGGGQATNCPGHASGKNADLDKSATYKSCHKGMRRATTESGSHRRPVMNLKAAVIVAAVTIVVLCGTLICSASAIWGS